MPARLKIAVSVAAAVLAVVGLFRLVDWAVELLWLDALGYVDIFWTIRSLKVGLFIAAFVVAFGAVALNLEVLARQADVALIAVAFRHLVAPTPVPMRHFGRPAPTVAPAPASDRVGLAATRFAIAGLAGLVFATVYYNHWDRLLRFRWSGPYGLADPIFDHDVGFYLFELPFLDLVQNGVLALGLLMTAMIAGGYVMAGAVGLDPRAGIAAKPGVLRHIAINLAALLLGLAWGLYLDRFELLTSHYGAVVGAGYTDVTVVLPALALMVGATLALAVAVLVPGVARRAGLTVATLGGYLALALASLVAVPWAVQSFTVEPNELELETPYLRHNIRFTREAYGLTHVEERSYDAVAGLTRAALERNQQTIDNVRLWDWRPVIQTFRQLQQIRTYYEFNDVDVDRYVVNGEYRQVMIAARELSGTLPVKAETWVNRHLQYTHGYGLAMSLAAKKTEQGTPVFLIKDLPPRSEPGLAVREPALYFSERSPDYRIVATGVEEFHYPRGDDNVYSSYTGRGDVVLDAAWKKVLFALHALDVRILLTAYTHDASRIQIWRSVGERIARIAPFLTLDADPYPVLDDGRLFWIQDAYVTSPVFPYSEPHRGDFNYIRNSVKVVVDAYHGEAVFYVVDEADPVLGVYRRAMPRLFRRLADMPDGLRRHLRYPQDLFEVQVAKFATYHMTHPQVFYNGEDLWTSPREREASRPMALRPLHVPGDDFGAEAGVMQPYFVLMRLLGEERMQFLLMTPLTPARRDNMIAWMAARSDAPGYGELVVYKLPKDRLILGPTQVEAMINQDTEISRQLTLWDQRGTRVIRGHLLVVPIEQSFLYVKPIYLIAVGTDIPQLQRVIVSDGDKLAMEPTLEEALAAVFGEARPRRPGDAEPGGRPDAMAGAKAQLKRAQDALVHGDWDAFGRAMRDLKAVIGE